MNMTGHTLQAVGHRVVFHAVMFSFQRRKRENNKTRMKEKKTKTKLDRKMQQMGERLEKVKYQKI